MLSHRIYYDSTFKHIPKNLNLWPQEIQDMVRKKNESKWTADIVMEYKGRKLDPQKFNSLKPTQKYEMLLKLLNIIKIMKDNHVVHADLHDGNLVWDDDNETLAVIDYGVTFLEGERSEEIEQEEDMCGSVAFMMTNSTGVSTAIDEQLKIYEYYKPPEKDEVIKFIETDLSVSDTHKLLIQFSEKQAIPFRGSDGKLKDVIFYVGDSLLRLMHDDIYRKLLKLTVSLDPPFF